MPGENQFLSCAFQKLVLTCTINIGACTLEVGSKYSHVHRSIDGCYVEGYSVDQAQEEAEPGHPAMKDVQSLVANAGDDRYHVGFHASGNDPGHQGDGDHACSHSEWRRTEPYALPVKWPRDEAVENNEDESNRRKEDHSTGGKYDGSPTSL